MLAVQPGQSFNSTTLTRTSDCDAAFLMQKARLSGTVPPRSFSSRHVPAVAEDLAVDLAPSGQRQLQGLLMHLKKDSSVLANRQKAAMATDCEHLVPEEYHQVLRAEFERRCLYGERTNTEYMTSLKFTRWLQECGIVNGLHGFGARCERPPNTISLATADVVFHKALRDCEYAGKRLNYELFCKALLLVSQQMHPDLDDASAFSEVLSQIVALANERLEDSEESYCDLSLDPNVVMTLDNFKPALYDLFFTVCGLKLENPNQGKPGLGTIRKRERSFMQYSGMTGYSAQGSTALSALDRHMASRMLQRQTASSISSCRTSDSTCEPESCKGMETLRTGSEQSDAENEMNRLVGLARPDADDKADEADSLAAKAGVDHDKARYFETEKTEEWAEDGTISQDSPGLVRNCHDEVARQEAEMPTPLDSYIRSSGTCMGVPEESQVNSFENQVTFINGVPTIRDRCRRMSVEQMLLMCKILNVIPELATRCEVIGIFKRSQHTGFSQGHGSSLHGYLSYEEFVDAIGQLAIKSYSKQPFSEEYPEAHEKVEAFLLRILPSDQRKLRDQFLQRHGLDVSR